ncbi:histidine phosphatase family protein [Paenibacillus senegalensis]|uniref:histidine phosphatase family protein n=1 Tax=Paenibacillus senegalensis TaxID=1465766 RepID=UPI000287BF9E|nr:histidine phosphatase family protein [Paenibacillus senegalensis]
MTRFYLLRHGETDWNRDGNRYCGRTDIGLSEEGQRQIHNTALRLKEVSFDAIYSSTLQRAVLSAQALQTHHKLDITRDERLVEIDFGQWEGWKGAQISERDPQGWKLWITEPELYPAGGSGETAGQVADRAASFFAEISKRHEGGCVAVVAHNTLFRIYLARMLEMPMRNYRNLSKDNTGISIIELQAEQFRLIQLNG